MSTFNNRLNHRGWKRNARVAVAKPPKTPPPPKPKPMLRYVTLPDGRWYAAAARTAGEARAEAKAHFGIKPKGRLPAGAEVEAA